jgi:uncharacterized protein (TIGR04255 family)
MIMDTPVSFKRPPVVETVLGVQFARTAKLGHSDLAEFWKHLGPPWPTVDFAPEAEEQFETFGDAVVWGGAKLRLMAAPRMRLQIRNPANNRMIQVQNGRFLYNWLGGEAQEYPGYSKMRPEFDELFQALVDFLGSKGYGPVQPNQWEVTYVNHIPKGTVWNDPSDWGDLLPPLLGCPKGLGNLSLEGLAGNCSWRFEIAPERGRLHVEIQHARLGSPAGKEALVIKLTARGPVSNGGMSIDEGLNLGHEIIVTTFRDITSDKAHEYWGLIR